MKILSKNKKSQGDRNLGLIPVKSVGNSTTTSFDVDNRREAHKILLAITEMVGMRVRDIEQNGSVTSVSINNSDFYSYSHQRRLDIPTSSTNSIYRTVRKLFDKMCKGEDLRRFSVNISELSSNDFFQLSIMENYNKKEEILDKTIDKLRYRFGYDSVIRSCFLHSAINPLIGGVVMEDEYPMMSSKF